MKAIPTKYKGYLFRSRLEARWAVFLDALGLEWEYEPQGFDLEFGGKYLPDFYVPEKKLWLEIKGNLPTEADLHKVAHFGLELSLNETGRIYILCGDIPYPYPKIGNAIAHHASHLNEISYNYCWQQCPLCLSVDIAYLGLEFCEPCVNNAIKIVEQWLAGTLDSPEEHDLLPNYINLEAFLKMGDNVDKFRNIPDYERGIGLLPRLFNKKYFLSGHESRNIRNAYAAARSARFEHGASGRSV